MTNLPLSDKPFFPVEDAFAPSASTPQPLVLIFGADRDIRFMLRTLLEMWNFRVEEAESVEEAIRISKNAKPNLVLMDTTISLIGNLATMRRMREHKFLSNTPFILISGYSQPHFRSMALAVGAADFLIKPLDFDSLESSLNRNIEKHNLTHNQTGGFL